MAIPPQSRALFEREALPHLAALYNFALALAGANAAEDLVQTTCVQGLEHLDSYRPGSNMRAWLFTILRNEWVSRHRHAERRARVEVDPPELPDEAADLEATLIAQRWSAEIDGAGASPGYGSARAAGSRADAGHA